MPSLVQPKDYDLLLLFNTSDGVKLDTTDAARSSLWSIKRDYRALGAAVKDSGTEVVFFNSSAG